MASDSVDLRVRVILVTTRAALRHADGDPGHHRAIVLRGRALLDALRADLDDRAAQAVERGHAQLDELEPI